MYEPTQAEIEAAVLKPDAIEGVISGDPQATAAELHRSRDGRETVFLWTCRACTYEWRFESDETARVLEGEAFVDRGAGERRLGPGDEAGFKAGETARWRVPGRLKKLSFCRDVRPRPSLVARALRKLGLAAEPA
jgi:uncharacterized cupin superfamily protein